MVRRCRFASTSESHSDQELEADTSFAGLRVTRVLDQAIARYGCPRRLRVDNGPEFSSRHFLAWAVERKIEVVHIRPGRPVENAYVESFHGRLREECLNLSWFRNLGDARQKLALRREQYNSERPHSSLGYRTPQEFAEQARAASCGKDGDTAALENASAGASGVSHFPTAPAAAADQVQQACRIMP